MKTITDETVSKNPIQIPDDSDLNALQLTREKIARDIAETESLIAAKGSSEFQKIIMDSYQSMQMIERAAIMLDSKKPDFALTFAGLQGRWRERLSLTEELVSGKRRIRQKKTVLKAITEKLDELKARIKSLTVKR